MHRASVEAYGGQFSRPGKMVSNGAYVLKEWVVQSHIKLERNPNYWDNDDTIIDTVYYYPIEDQSTELKRYRAGEIDRTEEVPSQQIKWIRKNLADELQISPYLGSYYFGFNLTRPPFKDNLKLRRALSMAINREIITDKVIARGEKPLYSWVPPGISGYKAARFDYADWSQKKRVEEARRLYKEAGYSLSNPLTVEIRYNTSENHKKLAIAIAAMWKQTLGVKTRLVNEEWKVFLENRKQKQVTQVFRAGWIGDYNDPYNFMEILHSKHGLNDSAQACLRPRDRFWDIPAPKSTRPLTTYWCPSRPGHQALRNNFASSLLLHTWLPMTGRRVWMPTLLPLWRYAHDG